MVQFIAISLAVMAAINGAFAFTRPCPVFSNLCGYTLNNGVYGYTRDELIAALRAAGKDPNVPGIIEHTVYDCVNPSGGIIADSFCGNGKCVEPNPGNPECSGENACCKA